MNEREPEAIEGLYDRLRHYAARLMRTERREHTLGPTALVNEAYLRLRRSPEREPEDVAAYWTEVGREMRRTLVDHARRRAAVKRDRGRESWHESKAETRRPEALLDLDEALEALARVHPRAARVIDMRHFAGLEYDLIANALETSVRTVHNELNVGREFLRERIERGKRS
ncbi:MAG: RNA polymerase subunit sigma-70 [bacterium]|nr:RNA polymerase subunit sigma-70 [bacterium]